MKTILIITISLLFLSNVLLLKYLNKYKETIHFLVNDNNNQRKIIKKQSVLMYRVKEILKADSLKTILYY